MLVEKINKSDTNLIFVYTTCANIEEARSIALLVINDHMAVCADFWPISSIYPWQGVVEEVNQCMLVLTTQKVLASKLVTAIERVHSYSVPSISVCDTLLSSQAYRFWTEQTLGQHNELLTSEESQLQKDFENESGYHPGHLK